MNENKGFDDGVEVGVPCCASGRLGSRFGGVPGLVDEELATVAELERLVYRQEWGPVLALPYQGKGRNYWGSPDGDGGVDFGAFGTVDFDRCRSEYDRAQYKEEKLKGRLKDCVILLDIIRNRITGRAKHKVLKYVRMGLMDLGDIKNVEMYRLAEMYLYTLRLRQEIVQLQQRRQERVSKRLKAWLEG